jgi:hypothetical protein
MTRTTGDDCDGEESAADTEGEKPAGSVYTGGRVQLGLMEITRPIRCANFPLIVTHFHRSNLREPLVFPRVESSIAFNGRVIFQRRERSNGHL